MEQSYRHISPQELHNTVMEWYIPEKDRH